MSKVQWLDSSVFYRMWFLPVCFFLMLLSPSCSGDEGGEQLEIPDTGTNPELPAPDSTPPDGSEEDGEGDTNTPEVIIPTAGLADGAWPMRGHDPFHTNRSPYLGARSAVVRWSYATGAKVSAAPSIGADGTVYVASVDNNLYALDSSTGTEKWFFSTNGSLESSPAVGSDGAVYVGSYDGNLYALEPNGLKRWEVITNGAIRSSPVLTESGLVCIGSRDGKLYAATLDGSIAWTYETAEAIESSPAVGADGRIYVGSEDDALHAVSDEGEALWTFATEGDVRASPAIGADGTIYVASLFGQLANLYALTPDGVDKWAIATDGGIEGSPAIRDDGSLVVGTLNGVIYLITADGEVTWSTQVGAAVRGAPALDADGAMYVGALDTVLYAFERSGAPRWNAPMDGLVWTGPVIGSDGTIYVGAGASVRAVGGGGPCEGEKPDCDDGDPCTADTCAPEQGCIHEALCNDDNPCTNDTCDGEGGCIFEDAPDTLICDDGYACTSDGACAGGQCIPAVNTCGPALSSWPVRGRDTKHQSRSPWPGAQDGSVAWSIQLGTQISSSPVLAKDGTVYIGSSATIDGAGKLHAVSTDGTLLWAFATEGQVTASAAVNQAGTIYIGSSDGYLYALSPEGQELWRYTVGAAIRSSATIAPDGTIYVGSENNHLHAIHPNGKSAWVYQAEAEVSTTVALDDSGVLYVGSRDGILHAVHPDGTAKWLFQAGTSIQASSPTVGPDGAIYVGSFDKHLYAVNPDGTLRWKFETGDRIDTSPAIRADGAVVFGSTDGKIYTLNEQGTVIWSYDSNAILASSPALGSDGAVYFGLLQHLFDSFVALDPQGEELWVLPASDGLTGVFSSPAIGQDGTLYFGGDDGRLHAVGGGGLCEGLQAPDCDDEDPCTIDSCSPEEGCLTPTPLCDDGNPCTNDLCNALGECSFQAKTGLVACDDGIACTTNEYCEAGFCLAGAASCPSMESSWPMRGFNAQRQGRSHVQGPKSPFVKWIFDPPNPLEVFEAGGPSVALDGTIYVGGKAGELYALNPNGTLQWTSSLGMPIETTPLLTADGTIYVGLGTASGSGTGAIQALESLSGTSKWSFEVDGAVLSSPSAGPTGTVFFGSNDGHVYALSSTGTSLWTYDAGGQVRGSPAHSHDASRVYVAGYDANLHAVDADTGASAWTSALGGLSRSTPLVGPDGTIYVASFSNKAVSAFDPTGQLIWSTVLDGFLKTDMALGGEVLWVTQYAGYVSALSLVSVDDIGLGGVVYNSGAAPFDAPPCVDVQGTVYAGGSDGQIYRINIENETDFIPVSGWPFTAKPPNAGITSPASEVTTSLALGPSGTLYFGTHDGLIYAIGE